MGKSVLESHEKGKKHIAKFKSRNANASLFNFNIEKSNFVEQNNLNKQTPTALTSNSTRTNATINLHSAVINDANNNCNNCPVHCKLTENSTS